MGISWKNGGNIVEIFERAIWILLKLLLTRYFHDLKPPHFSVKYQPSVEICDKTKVSQAWLKNVFLTTGGGWIGIR